MLEKENPNIFNSTTNTFVDLYMKSGMFVTEVVKRLFEHTRPQYDTDITCIKHILENQVYGLAPSPILDAITRNYIFGFDPTATINQSNFVKKDAIELVKNNTLHQEVNKVFNRQEGLMRFTSVIGNPPYQDRSFGDNDFAPPIYHLFMDSSYSISDRVMLITPGRFLFNAGSTPKAWNSKMLKDPHLKVMSYEAKSSAIFPNTDIMGGIAITYHDTTKNFGAIGTFTSSPELNSIAKKAAPANEKNSLMSIIYLQNKYNLEVLLREHPEVKPEISSNGADRRLRNNAFDRVSLFTETKIASDDIRIIGLISNKRVWRYLPQKYFDMSHENINKYKVVIPAANGSGALGEVIPTPLIGVPLIGEPLVGYTQTFISVGSFDTRDVAENCMKYIKSKFCRAMLGILKITQTNSRETWKLVPIQDFTNNSDINWAKPISEIDKQLFAKYNLSDDEIKYIEEKVQAMD